MEVLFYQGLIVITLVFVRIIAPKYLQAACLIWTVLTLVNLFWPPLIVLQLFVVWGTYGVIRPKATVAPIPDEEPGTVSTEAAHGSLNERVVDVVAAFERSLKELQAQNARVAELRRQELLESEQFSESERSRTSETQRQRDVHAAEIRGYVTELMIPHLVHFTRCENLRSIFRHGLHSVTSSSAEDIRAIRNDKIRLDGRPDGISLSVTFPNYRMFYKYRQLDESSDWAVLILSNTILWEKECGFFKYNAADSRMRGLTRDQTMTSRALREMFENFDQPRERWLRPYDPSDPQAEVLVYDHIEPSFIEAVAFETADATDRWIDDLGGADTICAGRGNGLFGPRAKIREG